MDGLDPTPPPYPLPDLNRSAVMAFLSMVTTPLLTILARMGASSLAARFGKPSRTVEIATSQLLSDILQEVILAREHRKVIAHMNILDDVIEFFEGKPASVAGQVVKDLQTAKNSIERVIEPLADNALNALLGELPVVGGNLQHPGDAILNRVLEKLFAMFPSVPTSPPVNTGVVGPAGTVATSGTITAAQRSFIPGKPNG